MWKLYNVLLNMQQLSAILRITLFLILMLKADLRKLKGILTRFGKDYFIIGDVEISLFELAWHLTGLEKYMVGMLCDEPWLNMLNDRVEEWSTGLALQLGKSRG